MGGGGRQSAQRGRLGLGGQPTIECRQWQRTWDALKKGALKRGRSNMGFFTTRERAGLDKWAETEGEGNIREFARRDFASLRRPPVAGNVDSLLQRVTETSLKQIDDLIVELRTQREKLLSESARVQREIIEYAKLNQSTMQSTKIITESLKYWNKIPDAPGISELHVDNTFKTKHHRSGAEALTQHSDDNGTIRSQAEAAAVHDSPSTETNAARNSLSLEGDDGVAAHLLMEVG
jgi:hypothetical protein